MASPRAGFHNVHAVRVMALDAVHLALDDRVVLRQVEFRVGIQVALKGRRRGPCGIDDEFAASAAYHDVFAGGAVAGFAPCWPVRPACSRCNRAWGLAGKARLMFEWQSMQTRSPTKVAPRFPAGP